jgi:hypothetical protein
MMGMEVVVVVGKGRSDAEKISSAPSDSTKMFVTVRP